MQPRYIRAQIAGDLIIDVVSYVPTCTCNRHLDESLVNNSEIKHCVTFGLMSKVLQCHVFK